MTLLFVGTFCHSQVIDDYERFVDSADIHIDFSTEKAIAFLDSIPKPVEDYLKKGLPDYYMIRGIVSDEANDFIRSHQCSALALKYAKENKNYKIAGDACVEIFVSSYYINKDTAAFKYLNEARDYYKLSDYTYGDIEVDLTYAYARFLDKDYDTCNTFLLNNLSRYKGAKKDAYFYMFANYMLTRNYINLSDLKKAHFYFNEFKTLKKDSTVVSYNYLSFESHIHVDFAQIYFENKQMDSTRNYLSKAAKQKHFMTEDILKTYLKLNAGYYRSSGNEQIAGVYKDSLSDFESRTYKNVIKSGFQINNDLVKTESALEAESNMKFRNGMLVVVLFIALAILSILSFIFYKKQILKTLNLSNQTSNLSYLKSNNEKLVVKVQGLEEYINNLKKDIKRISIIGEHPVQRDKIKELYRSLHHHSSTILDKKENHMDLINDLNIDFFKKINELHPQLNNSEIVICYYLYVGFKNKEIAVFLNTSVRAVESKRYRIGKKIHLDKNKVTLLEHLKKTFRAERIIES